MKTTTRTLLATSTMAAIAAVAVMTTGADAQRERREVAAASAPSILYAAGPEADYAGRCENAGRHGIFSNTSNQQRCTIGAWVCVRRGDSANYPGAGHIVSERLRFDDAQSLGLIMQPWDVNWHETGGNNGYVQNVCNGTAGSYNLHTLVLFDNQGGPVDPSGPPNIDTRAKHFADQLKMIQQMCAGRCETRFVSYHVELDLWDDDPQTLHLSSRNQISRDSFEFMALTQYLSWGRITMNHADPWWRDNWVRQANQGMDMGANGWQPQMVNTIRVGPHPNWWEAPAQMAVGGDKTRTVGKLVIRLAILLFL